MMDGGNPLSFTQIGRGVGGGGGEERQHQAHIALGIMKGREDKANISEEP